MARETAVRHASKPAGLALTTQRDLHVAVVGAGAFGGWTAYHLLRRGARVTLLDFWGPGNSRSSSGGESRLIRAIHGTDRIYVDLVATAYRLWEEAEARWNRRLLFKTGVLWLFGADDAYARDSLPSLAEHGLSVQHMDGDEARRRFPQMAFDDVESVYLEPNAGYLLARQACVAVRDAFVAEGGRYVQAAVEAGPVVAGEMSGVGLSDGSRLDADLYVFACGPWLARLFPGVLGETIQTTRQEVYYFGLPEAGAAAYAKLPPWVDYYTDGRLYYGFPSIEGRGFKIGDDTRGPAFDPTTGSRTPSERGIAKAQAYLGRRFPALREAPLVEARVCQYANSPDGHFIVDRHPGASNVWVLGGGSGRGFKFCPALGAYAVDAMLEHRPIEPFFGLARLGLV